MHGRVGTVRTGIFLFLAAVVVVLAPVQPPVDSGAALRTVSEQKNETSEQRDSEKLRERLPGIASSRRALERHEEQWRSHPPVSRRDLITAPDPTAMCTGAASRTTRRQDECTRTRHSPPLLQVFRR